MSTSIALPNDKQQQRTLLYTSWAMVILLTVPEIILRAFMQVDVSWLMTARIIVLTSLFVLATLWQTVQPLRGLILAFLVIYGVEGWLLGTLVQQSQIFHDIFGADANALFFGERLLRIGAVLVMLIVQLRFALTRRDLFLAVGDLKATAEPAKGVGIPNKPESWTVFGRNFAIISIGILLFFMIPAFMPSLSNFSVGLLLFAALCAAMNAFAEEFLYRSALLPHLLPLFDKGTVLLLVPLWFGLAHYFGVPNGITGVLITAIGGWFYSKSMIETRGIVWAWGLHFLADFAVYMVVLLAGGF